MPRQGQQKNRFENQPKNKKIQNKKPKPNKQATNANCMLKYKPKNQKLAVKTTNKVNQQPHKQTFSKPVVRESHLQAVHTRCYPRKTHRHLLENQTNFWL